MSRADHAAFAVSSEPDFPTPEVETHPAASPRTQDDAAIGHLRAFVTLLVLLHHSILAYHLVAPPPPASLLADPRWWMAFPVVDAARSGFVALITSFNDTFFMSLMFLLSGLFVTSGLRRKGSAGFLRGRALRLGLPFVAAAAIVAPLAYYPSYLQSGGSGLPGFARQWLALGNWPAGPAWFLWVLLAFDALAALVFVLLPRLEAALERLASYARQHPAAILGLLVALSAAAYLPLALTVGPFGWASFGPFFVQTSRILHYGVYFAAGIALGAVGLERGMMAVDGSLARRWPLWTTGASVVFVLAMAIFLTAMSPQGAKTPRLWETVGGLAFVLTCAFTSFALLSLFSRYARRRTGALDSLRANAFGMYLVHYAFASWLQLALLRTALPGLAKGSLVFLGTVALSWTATAALRRIPGVAKVI